MINYLSNKITEYFKSNMINADIEEIKNLKLGIEIILINISKTSILILLAICLNIFWYAVIFIFSLSVIKRFSFGIHLSSVACTTYGIIKFLLCIYISTNLNISILHKILIFCMSFFIFFKFAPSGTHNRPIGKLEYISLKYKTLICSFILFIISIILHLLRYTFNLPNIYIYSNIIILTLVIQVMDILPITYKIFKKRRF